MSYSSTDTIGQTDIYSKHTYTIALPYVCMSNIKYELSVVAPHRCRSFRTVARINTVWNVCTNRPHVVWAYLIVTFDSFVRFLLLFASDFPHLCVFTWMCCIHSKLGWVCHIWAILIPKQASNLFKFNSQRCTVICSLGRIMNSPLNPSGYTYSMLWFTEDT